jgi:hypothetical protein
MENGEWKMENRGIEELGNRGIEESGNRGIEELGNRGIEESENRRIEESGNRGIFLKIQKPLRDHSRSGSFCQELKRQFFDVSIPQFFNSPIPPFSILHFPFSIFHSPFLQPKRAIAEAQHFGIALGAISGADDIGLVG